MSASRAGVLTVTLRSERIAAKSGCLKQRMGLVEDCPPMGFIRRNRGSASSSSEPEQVDLGTLLLQGEDMINQLAQAHMSWGLGAANRWGLDQSTGIITWTFPDKTATAPAQIIGS